MFARTSEVKAIVFAFSVAPPRGGTSKGFAGIKWLGRVGVRMLDWRASIHHMGSWRDDGVHFSRKASKTVGGKVAKFVQHFLG